MSGGELWDHITENIVFEKYSASVGDWIHNYLITMCALSLLVTSSAPKQINIFSQLVFVEPLQDALSEIFFYFLLRVRWHRTNFLERQVLRARFFGGFDFYQQSDARIEPGMAGWEVGMLPMCCPPCSTWNRHQHIFQPPVRRLDWQSSLPSKHHPCLKTSHQPLEFQSILILSWQ